MVEAEDAAWENETPEFKRGCGAAAKQAATSAASPASEHAERPDSERAEFINLVHSLIAASDGPGSEGIAAYDAVLSAFDAARAAAPEARRPEVEKAGIASLLTDRYRLNPGHAARPASE